MTGIEKFNLLWLCHAMTVSNHCPERYYYDIENQMFFYTSQPSSSSETFDIHNCIGLQLLNQERRNLLERMKILDSEACEVVEIPRLNVDNKMQIQLLFLLKIEGVYRYSKLIGAVKRQLDEDKFILDTLLVKNDLLAPMLERWEEFKLRIVFNCVNDFACSIRVHVSISS